MDGSLTGAPVLEQVGEKDDCGPVAKARALVAVYEAKKIAAPVTIALYEGAYHSWTVPEFMNARHFPNHASPSKCPLWVLRPGYALLDPDGTMRPFNRDEWTACSKASKGYTQGFDRGIREKSFATAWRFSGASSSSSKRACGYRRR